MKLLLKYPVTLLFRVFIPDFKIYDTGKMYVLIKKEGTCYPLIVRNPQMKDSEDIELGDESVSFLRPNHCVGMVSEKDERGYVCWTDEEVAKEMFLHYYTKTFPGFAV